MEKNNNVIFLSLGIIVVLLLGMFSANLMMNNKEPSTINVITGNAEEFIRTLSANGSVEKMVSPDQAEIYLSVETLNKLATTSQEENATISDAVRKALKLAGVYDAQIETTSYTVQEQYAWDSSLQKSVSKGYKTTNAIKITTDDITRSGKIVDAAINAGATRVSNISFTLSKEKQETVKQEALIDAAKMAKTKAQNIATGLGIELGKVKNVSESYNYYTPNYRDYSYAMASDSMEAKIDTPISPSDVSVTANVSVTYELK